jgi:hypothetical protein
MCVDIITDYDFRKMDPESMFSIVTTKKGDDSKKHDKFYEIASQQYLRALCDIGMMKIDTSNSL